MADETPQNPIVAAADTPAVDVANAAAGNDATTTEVKVTIAPTPDAPADPNTTTTTTTSNGNDGNGSSAGAQAQHGAEHEANSVKVSLADLCARGTALYAQRKFDDAAETYAQAADLQAGLRGEMDPDNAEVLFLYGRSLFRVGQARSDVLGGRAAASGDGGGSGGGNRQKQKQKDRKPKRSAGAAAANGSGGDGPEGSEGAAAAPGEGQEDEKHESEADRIAEEGVALLAEQAGGAKKEEEAGNKPLFQFTGDENFEDSDESDEEDEGEGDEEEEDDDLAIAFEILDLARVLYKKKLEIQEQGEGEGKGKENAEGDDPSVRHIKERLADAHDLLAEISLENERYPNAIADGRESLKYKKELYSQESEVIAEAHFKLSLALEFASITSTTDEGGEQSGPKAVDQDLRDEAANELEAAINSTKLKLQNKEVDLATMHSPEDNEASRKQIAEVKDMIAEMEQRLVDLKKPPIDVNEALYGPAGVVPGNAMGGILGATLGESPAQTEARIEEAKKSAKDLSGLVRKKGKDEPKPALAETTNGVGSNGKRKAEEPVDGEEEAKKVRVNEATGA